MSSSKNESALQSSNPPPPPDARSGRWWLRKLLPAGLFLAVGLLLIVLTGVAQRLGWIQAGTSAGVTSSDDGKQAWNNLDHESK